MNYNIQNAVSKIADPTRTTLEEAFEQGAEWMRYEICDSLQCAKDAIDDILRGVKNGDYDEIESDIEYVANRIDDIIN